MPSGSRILVMGATGYVGSRLVHHLLEQGYTVRAIGRSRAKLENCKWPRGNRLELVEADALDRESLSLAAKECNAAYYLVHSMYAGKDFEELDRKAAMNMISVSEEHDLQRIIYLGGLGTEKSSLSRHLRSRAEVAGILSSGKVPATVLRAAMLIGSGSASFEIMRYLVERLPAMTTPRWVRSKSQPIAISNALTYLVGCLRAEDTAGMILDIGGPEIVSYQELMRTYAQEAGLAKRIILPIPILTPRLSSYWVGLVTPIPSAIAKPLVESLSSDAICRNTGIQKLIPQKLLTSREAIHLAVAEIEHLLQQISPERKPFIPEWSQPSDPTWAGGPVFIDIREVETDLSIEEAWNPVYRIGGPTGWYYANWLWNIAGIADELVGGPGMKLGRTSCEVLKPGDYVDCWKCISVKPPNYMKLRAELSIPAKSTIEFMFKTLEEGGTRIRQRIRFVPQGLVGHLYWHVLLPIHHYIWPRLLQNAIKSANGKILSSRFTWKR